MRLFTVVRALVVGVALPTVFGLGCGGDGTGVVRVTGLRFASVPNSVGAGTTFTVTVELLRSSTDVATSATNEVTLTLLNGGTAVLNGTTTVAAVAGVATFSGLSINQAGTGRQFHAATPEFFGLSGAFAVARGLPSANQSTITPGPGSIPPNGAADLTFTFKDAFGNIVSNTPVSLSTSLAGSTLTPSSGVTNASGTFVSEFRSTATGSATVGAVIDGVPITPGAPYVVVDLCANQPIAMAFPATVNGAQPCGAYIATAEAPSVYSFSAPGGGAAFTLNATYQMRLEVTPSVDVPSVVGVTQSMPATGEWLLPAGNYVLRTGSIGGAGAFTLTAASVPANTGNAVRFLVSPATYTGQALASGDNASFYDDGSFSDLYLLYSPNPCTLTLQTSSFDNFFVAFDANDENAVPPGFSHPALGQDAVISLASCRSGNNPLLLVVNSFIPGGAGPYTLIVAINGAGAALRVPVSSRPDAAVRTVDPSTLVRRVRPGGR